ncbi:hypothetical protein D9615_001306 [Tricholomella constricta]|uniref:Uncharacterized protein n=1 Tax=Tricholomella constricta TaxID=117010 RepID=A0A8H5HKF6_9AGAR|nr:hypothetical protein D9615_001306 [Tricholomella constricta]
MSGSTRYKLRPRLSLIQNQSITMSSTHTGHIFNVSEATGKHQAEFETTAAEAQIEAPTAKIAREIEENAEHVHDVAHDAADAAKAKGRALTGTPPSAIDQLQQQARQKTEAAVAEGHHDVDAAKAVGAGYVEQVKTMAAHAIATAQSYLPASVGGHTSTTAQPASGVASSIQGGAATVVDTTKEYVASAQEAVKPHIEHVKGAVQGGPATPASSTGIPATSAPLESGPHTIGTPYPATTTTQETKVAENAT